MNHARAVPLAVAAAALLGVASPTAHATTSGEGPLRRCSFFSYEDRQDDFEISYSKLPHGLPADGSWHTFTLRVDAVYAVPADVRWSARLYDARYVGDKAKDREFTGAALQYDDGGHWRPVGPSGVPGRFPRDGLRVSLRVRAPVGAPPTDAFLVTDIGYRYETSPDVAGGEPAENGPCWVSQTDRERLRLTHAGYYADRVPAAGLAAIGFAAGGAAAALVLVVRRRLRADGRTS
ncbi:hypothetical protein [Streptomyces fradiae]|uniref:hypothetical protein n=1 Tax=Streptomyces fradiae TaxID=1906 RepID=UPI003698AEBD